MKFRDEFPKYFNSSSLPQAYHTCPPPARHAASRFDLHFFHLSAIASVVFTVFLQISATNMAQLPGYVPFGVGQGNFYNSQR